MTSPSPRLLLAAALALASPSSALPAVTAPAAAPAEAAFAALAEDYWETVMRHNPLWATFINHPRYHDALGDNSAAGRAAQKAQLERLRERLAALDLSRLDGKERTSAEVMRLELELAVEGFRHAPWHWGVDHMDGPQTWIQTVIGLAQPMKDERDAEALLLRLKGFPAHFSNLAADLREGLSEERVAARVPVEKAIRQLKELVETPPAKTPIASAVERLPERLRARYRPLVLRAVETHVLPSYRHYLRFLEEEYLPRTRTERIGLGDLPGGREAYRHQIRQHTTLDRSPRSLHRMGLKEVRALRGELEAIARRMGHRGDLKSFLKALRDDPKNFFETREQVLAEAKRLVARATERLPDYFGRLPKTPLVVEPIEPYKEKNDVAARYYQPPDDLSRPGIYFINTYAPRTRARFAMTSLAVHEGVPGHHFQIALALEDRSLPAFRRNGGFNAFIEGWALYTERLASDMGLYEDDLSRVGMLSDQLWRACRLVVDTGIHAFGWDRERAIAYMSDNIASSREEIEAEVDRYTIWPGQALSYMVGAKEILSLREESRRRLGKGFDLRAFHDRVLADGPVPLPVLRSSVLAAPRGR